MTASDRGDERPKKAKRNTYLKVEISRQKNQALHKLKVFKDLKKYEVVELGLDLVMQHSVEEIVKMVEERRKGSV